MVLIVARGIQGCCAAVLSPATLTIIMRQLAGQQQSRAVGTWASMSGVGGGLGVFLGGLLTQTLSWRWIFFINVPVGAVILAMGWVAVNRDVPRAAARQLDIWGAVTLTLAMLSLVFGIVEAGTEGWLSGHALASFGVAAVAAVACWWIESRVAQQPVIPSWLAGNRIIAGTNVVLLLLYMVIIAPWFLLSFYMQTVLGLDPLQAGAGLLPQAVIIAATAQAGSWAARHYNRGIRRAQRRRAVVRGGRNAGDVVGSRAGWAGRIRTCRAGPPDLARACRGLTLPAATIAATRLRRGRFRPGVRPPQHQPQFGAALGLSIVYTAGTARANPRAGLHVPAGYADAALLGTFVALAAAATAFALIRDTPNPAVPARGSRSVRK